MENKKNVTDRNENVLISKVRVYGDHIKVSELIDALKKNLESTKDNGVIQDGPVCMHGEKQQGLLTAIYACKFCERLHLVSGNHESFDNGRKFDKEYFAHAKKVYINRIHGEEDTGEGSISKVELLNFLESKPHFSSTKSVSVVIEHIENGEEHPLSEVCTCGNEGCSSLHFLSGYENDTVTLQ